MKVVTVMRHGPTEPGFGKTDADRALTDDGARVMRRAACGLRGLGFDFGLTSPLTRTLQTARIVWEELGLTVPLWSEPALESGADPGEQLIALESSWAAQPSASSVLMVGHMPDVAQLTATFLGDLGRGFAFVPGAAARILFDDVVGVGAGHLEWMLRPEELAERAQE